MTMQSGLGRITPYFFSLLIFGSILNTRGQSAIVDNLSNSDDGNLTVLSSVYWANGFTTDGTSYSLGEVQVSLAAPADTTSDLVVQLWNDNAGLPGSSIATLSTAANPAAAGVFSFTATSAVTLDPSTPYWVVLSVASGAGDYDWNSTLTTTSTGVGTLDGLATFFGGSWTASTAGDRALFSVTAVPEPSTLALICAGGILGGFILQRRRATA